MNIQEIILHELRELFPSSIFSWSHFCSLWDKYANISGFFTGLLLIGVISFVSDFKFWGSGKKGGIINILALVTLINSIYNLYIIICNFVQNTNNSSSSYYIGAAFNPLSLIVLCLIINECYKNDIEGAFLFGISTFGVALLMFGSQYSNDYVEKYVFARVIIAGILCVIVCRFKYFYTSYIAFSIFYIIEEGVLYYLTYWFNKDNITFNLDMLAKILSMHVVDYCMMSIILVVWIIYERIVLTVGTKQHATP